MLIVFVPQEATNIIETVDALQSWNSEVLQEDSSQWVYSHTVNIYILSSTQ